MPQARSQPTKKHTPARATSNGTAEPLDVLTLEEAAAYLRVTPEDVVHMIAAESLPARKFGAEWRFYKAGIQDWLSHPPKKGILRHLGRIKGDPHAEEMLRDIYAQRGRPETEEE